MGNGVALVLIVATIVIVGVIIMASIQQTKKSNRSTVFVIPEWVWPSRWRPWLGPGGEQRYFPPAGPNLGPGGQHNIYPPPAPNPTPNPAPPLGPGGKHLLGPGGTFNPSINPFPAPIPFNPHQGFTGSQEPALLGKGSEEGFENFAAF